MATQRKIEPLPDSKELKRRYGRFIDNAGLRAVRDWAQPNSAAATDEKAISKVLQGEDTATFAKLVKGVLRTVHKHSR